MGLGNRVMIFSETVVLDLRADSPTYIEWVAAEFTAENHHMLFIPEGHAHGFQTLADDTQLLYLMSDWRLLTST